MDCSLQLLESIIGPEEARAAAQLYAVESRAAVVDVWQRRLDQITAEVNALGKANRFVRKGNMKEKIALLRHERRGALINHEAATKERELCQPSVLC